MKTRMRRTSAALARAEADNLRALLRAEESSYAELLVLSRRQGDLMKRQDAGRLDSVLDAWRDRLPAAEAARRARESYLLDLGRRYGIETDDLRMSRLARSTRGTHGQALREVLSDWERTTGALMRRNALNGRMAGYCLDLVQKEAAILCRGLSGKNGCYDAQGGKARLDCVGVIVKQA